MGMKFVLYFAICVGACAVILQLNVLKPFRESMLSTVHETVGSYIKTCPYHLWINLLSSIGIISTEPRGKGSESTSNNNVVRRTKDRMFTKEELSKYTGAGGSLELYLAVLGRVYDVQSGEGHYGPGKGYSFFSGRDGTKAFMTGDFTEKGLVDEVSGLTLTQMLELANWMDFYEKTYIYKGKLVGNFYDENGEPRPALLEAERMVGEALKEKASKEEHKRKFPPCNSSWTKAKGGWVSCSNKSGGITRDWVGVPRRYHTPGQANPVCVCVRTTGTPYDNPDSTADRGELDNPHLEQYSDCKPTAISCKTS